MLDVYDGVPAEGLILAGDIITTVDGVSVGSREELDSLLEGFAVTNAVDVAGTRSGEPFNVAVPLSPDPDNAVRASIGIVSESKLEAIAPPDLAVIPLEHQLARPVVVNGEIYLYEPVGGSWTAYPGVPAARMAALNTELYSIATEENPLSLVRIRDGQILPVQTTPFTVPGVDGTLLEVTPVSFGGVLTSVGDLLLVNGLALSDQVGLIPILYAVDIARGVVAWSSPLGAADSGNAYIAFDGFRSPAGNQAAVGLVEFDEATGSVSEVRTYLIWTTDGSRTVPVGAEQVDPRAEVTGWFDEGSLAYVLPLEAPQVMHWSITSGEQEVMLTVPAEDASSLITVVPVGDGRHVVSVERGQVWLIDVDRLVITRPISQSCLHIPAGGLAG